MDTDILWLTIGLAAGYNLVVFCVYATDKVAARNGTRRVPESTLIWLAVVFGGLGAFACQRLLRHKTRKRPFATLLPSLLALQTVVAAALILFPQQIAGLLRGVPGLFGL